MKISSSHAVVNMGLGRWGILGRKQLSILGLLLGFHTKTGREDLGEGKEEVEEKNQVQ